MQVSNKGCTWRSNSRVPCHPGQKDIVLPPSSLFHHLTLTIHYFMCSSNSLTDPMWSQHPETNLETVFLGMNNPYEITLPSTALFEASQQAYYSFPPDFTDTSLERIDWEMVLGPTVGCAPCSPLDDSPLDAPTSIGPAFPADHRSGYFTYEEAHSVCGQAVSNLPPESTPALPWDCLPSLCVETPSQSHAVMEVDDDIEWTKKLQPLVDAVVSVDSFEERPTRSSQKSPHEEGMSSTRTPANKRRRRKVIGSRIKPNSGRPASAKSTTRLSQRSTARRQPHTHCTCGAGRKHPVRSHWVDQQQVPHRATKLYPDDSVMIEDLDRCRSRVHCAKQGCSRSFVVVSPPDKLWNSLKLFACSAYDHHAAMMQSWAEGLTWRDTHFHCAVCPLPHLASLSGTEDGYWPSKCTNHFDTLELWRERHGEQVTQVLTTAPPAQLPGGVGPGPWIKSEASVIKAPQKQPSTNDPHPLWPCDGSPGTFVKGDESKEPDTKSSNCELIVKERVWGPEMDHWFQQRGSTKPLCWRRYPQQAAYYSGYGLVDTVVWMDTDPITTWVRCLSSHTKEFRLQNIDRRTRKKFKFTACSPECLETALKGDLAVRAGLKWSDAHAPCDEKRHLTALTRHPPGVWPKVCKPCEKEKRQEASKQEGRGLQTEIGGEEDADEGDAPWNCEHMSNCLRTGGWLTTQGI